MIEAWYSEYNYIHVLRSEQDDTEVVVKVV